MGGSRKDQEMPRAWVGAAEGGAEVRAAMTGRVQGVWGETPPVEGEDGRCTYPFSRRTPQRSIPIFKKSVLFVNVLTL